MNRRSFFRMLGAGTAATVLPVIARAHEMTGHVEVKDAHQEVHPTHTSAYGAHTHSWCTCGSPHTHGCIGHLPLYHSGKSTQGFGI